MQHTPGQSQRQLRVGEQIRHVIAETLARGHFHHPTLLDHSSEVTVSEVRVSPDLKNATAYVSTLGGASLAEVIQALNDVAGAFQKEIGHTLTTRNTPKIRFLEDTSFAEADKIERILRSLKAAE